MPCTYKMPIPNNLVSPKYLWVIINFWNQVQSSGFYYLYQFQMQLLLIWILVNLKDKVSNPPHTMHSQHICKKGTECSQWTLHSKQGIVGGTEQSLVHSNSAISLKNVARFPCPGSGADSAPWEWARKKRRLYQLLPQCMYLENIRIFKISEIKIFPLNFDIFCASLIWHILEHNHTSLQI